MKKLLVIASVLCLPLAITSCGGDEKDGDKDKEKSEKAGATGSESEVAELMCHCLEEALDGETNADNISDSEANDMKTAYIECLTPHKEKLQDLKINNNVLEEMVAESCPEASDVLQALKNR